MDSQRPQPINTIRTITVKWSEYKADYEYEVTVLGEYENGERRAINGFSGDKDWATRYAEHYNLTVPAETDAQA